MHLASMSTIFTIISGESFRLTFVSNCGSNTGRLPLARTRFPSPALTNPCNILNMIDRDYPPRHFRFRPERQSQVKEVGYAINMSICANVSVVEVCSNIIACVSFVDRIHRPAAVHRRGRFPGFGIQEPERGPRFPASSPATIIWRGRFKRSLAGRLISFAINDKASGTRKVENLAGPITPGRIETTRSVERKHSASDHFTPTSEPGEGFEAAPYWAEPGSGIDDSSWLICKSSQFRSSGNAAWNASTAVSFAVGWGPVCVGIVVYGTSIKKNVPSNPCESRKTLTSMRLQSVAPRK